MPVSPLNTQETLEFPIINVSRYASLAAALHRGAADSMCSQYNSYPALETYLEQIDTEKYWEESLVDPSRLIRIAQLGNRALGIVELDLGNPRQDSQQVLVEPVVATIAGLYVPSSPTQAVVRRGLFEAVAQDAHDRGRATIAATVPEGSKLQIFYESQNLRRLARTAPPLELSSRVLLSQVTLEKLLD